MSKTTTDLPKVEKAETTSTGGVKIPKRDMPHPKPVPEGDKK